MVLQDENRHGDFFTAVLKARPELVEDWQARAWSKFFCLSVYVTMYLNDHQRSPFYESLGLDTKQFNRCDSHLDTPPPPPTCTTAINEFDIIQGCSEFIESFHLLRWLTSLHTLRRC